MLNLVELPLLLDTPLILGLAISAFIRLIYKLWYGLLAYLAIPLLSLPPETAWVIVLLGIIEAILITYAKRNRISVVAIVAGYWLSLAALISFVITFHGNELTLLQSQQEYIRISSSGVIGIILGYLGARLLWDSGRTLSFPAPKASFSAVISSLVLSVVLLTSLVASYVWVRTVTKQEQQQFKVQTDLVASNLARMIDESIVNHLKVVEYLARLSGNIDNEHWGNTLDRTIEAYPLFLTMLKTDQQGTLTQAAPAFAREALLSEKAFSVSDRDYFKTPKATNKSFVSDIFQGRGFGDDLIVALSAPIIKDGQFHGVIEGSLALKEIQSETQSLLPPSTHFLLVDSQRKLIFASLEIELAFGDSILNSSLHQFLTGGKANKDFYLSESGRRYVITETDLPNVPWPIIVGKEASELEANLIEVLSATHVFMLISLLCAIAVSYIVGRRISAPITLVTERVTNENDFIRQAELQHPVNSSISEVNLLDERLIHLAQRLARSNSKMQATLNLNRRLNTELSKANATLENKVRERTQQLESSLQVAQDATLTKERFIASLSHEVKTPLNGILGMTSYLMNTELPADVKDKIQIINDSGDRLFQFLDQVLQLSSMQELGVRHLKACHVDELLEECTTPYLDELQARSIELLLETKLATQVLLNPVGVRHIVTNLLANALKYSKANKIIISAYQNSKYRLTIKVEDNGIGIKGEERERLFTPYSQLSASTASSNGLGLYISRQLCEAMQGSLLFHTNIPHGCIFELDLPLVLPLSKAPDKDYARNLTPHVARKNLSIAVVDDVATNISVASSIMSLLGHEAKGYKSRQELITALNSHDFDLLFIDLFLENDNGLLVAKDLCERGLFDRQNIVLMTAATLSKEQELEARLYADSIVKKPISLDKIKSVLMAKT